MKDIDVVPDKLQSPINLKIIAMIGVSAVFFHLLINYGLSPDISEPVVLLFSMINPLITSAVAFVVAFRYKDALVFGKAYLSLAVGYLAIFLGELTYAIYESVLKIEPYPSIADAFFFIQYPLILIHLILNIRFFTPVIKKFTKIVISGIPILVVLSYIVLNIINEETLEINFDFIYGLFFVAFSSITLTFAVLGALTFRGGVLGKAWLLLLIGILCNTIGDTWYYNLEIFEQYDLTHPVNLFWYVGFWIMIYSLYKHRKNI